MRDIHALCVRHGPGRENPFGKRRKRPIRGAAGETPARDVMAKTRLPMDVDTLTPGGPLVLPRGRETVLGRGDLPRSMLVIESEDTLCHY